MKSSVLLIKFEKFTDELLAINLSNNLDEVIDEIEELLKKRNDIIKLIEESDGRLFLKDDLARILQKNNMLETKFSEVKISIADSISNIMHEKSLSSKKKKAHRGYMNVEHQNDGYFIDKKK